MFKETVNSMINRPPRKRTLRTKCEPCSLQMSTDSDRHGRSKKVVNLTGDCSECCLMID